MKRIALPVSKKTLLYTASALLLLCLCLVLATQLPACGDSEKPPSYTQTQTPSESETQPSAEPEGDDSLRTFYESMIAELEEKLLDEKQDNYIARLEYESRLEMLEKELANLAAGKNEGDLPTSGRPDTSPEESTTEPSTETQAPEPEEMSFRYTVEGGEAVICQYLGKNRNVVIPSEIEGYPVTRIADNAFTNANVITVSIPNTVTAIGWFAFYGCYSLESVTIPSSVTRIDYAAFDNCPTLTILCVPETYAASYAVSFGLRHRYL